MKPLPVSKPQTKEETMEKLSQSELIDKVSLAAGVSKKTVKQVLDTFSHQVASLVGAGIAVSTKLGKFYPKDSVARKMKSPLTGKEVDVPAKRSLAFKPSAENKNID